MWTAGTNARRLSPSATRRFGPASKPFVRCGPFTLAICTYTRLQLLVFTNMKPITSHPDSEGTLADTEGVALHAAEPGKQPRDVRFWLVFLGIGISVMITALELVRCALLRRLCL